MTPHLTPSESLTLFLAGIACACWLTYGLIHFADRPAPTKNAPPAQVPPAPVPAGAHPEDDDLVFGAGPLDLCMVIGCPELWSTDRLGWRTCVHHTKPLCKSCQRNPATQLQHVLCLPCHERISAHFDEFVDQALAIVNSKPAPDDEVGQADFAFWELDMEAQS